MGDIPIVLKLEDWPAADRAAWDLLFVEGDLFDGPCPARTWSEGTRRKRCQGYGQWLSFVSRTEPEMLDTNPSDRITQSRVGDYLAECRQRLKPSSIAGLCVDIYSVAINVDPERNWGWLKNAANRLRARANRLALPPAKPLTAGAIFSWSLRRLAKLRSAKLPPDLMTAVQFRDALMIGLLIARPVRSRALLAIRIGSQLRSTSDGYELRFDKADMKDGRARSFLLPAALVEPMRSYLAIYRPILLRGGDTDALWISRRGHPTTGDTLARYLPIVTERHLGVALRSHAFRHIAATSIAEADPEHVNIIRDILGHATLDMSQKHYNRATGLKSCDELQSLIQGISRDKGRRTASFPTANMEGI